LGETNQLGENPANPSTKNKGSTKAGENNQFIYPLALMRPIEAGAAEGMERYADTTAVVIEGERVQVGLAFEKAGCGSEPHSHPNEQFNFVLQGTFRVKIGDGDEMLAPKGSLVYFPPNVVHSSVALPGEDGQFFVVKDLAHGIVGIKANKNT
jgi:quercetin dioxygenase-like cupin family protein